MTPSGDTACYIFPSLFAIARPSGVLGNLLPAVAPEPLFFLKFFNRFKVSSSSCGNYSVYARLGTGEKKKKKFYH